MKRFLILLTALTLILTCTFGLIGCNEELPTGDGGLTQAEASSIYKSAAKSLWTMLGVDDPTVETAETMLMSVDVPNFTEEMDSDSMIDGYKHNLATMALYVNFIGDLYANENFVLTDKIVTFCGAATMGDMSYDSVLSMYSVIDKENDKIYFELGVGDPGLYNYTYFIYDIGYDFDATVATSYRMIYYEPGYVFNDQIFTADEKCYLADSGELELYQESLDAYVADFNQRKADGVFLTERFDTEFQRITDLAAKLN